MAVTEMQDAVAGPSEGYFTRLTNAVSHPFHEEMTWPQLALVVCFILCVTLMWRQVVNFIVEGV